MTSAPAGTTDAWGVTDGYEDTLHRWHPTRPATRAAIHAAMEVDRAAASLLPSAGDTSVLVLRPGQTRVLTGPAELTLEDGTRFVAERTLPPDLPLGYHTLRAVNGTDVVPVIVTPGRCHLPADLYTWGWATQLYAARSAASWGIGDLADLEWLGRWASGQGAGLVLVNPLGAPRPSVPQQESPYFPSSRRYRNPLYLRIEQIPGAAGIVDVERLAAEGIALNAERRIDRDRVHRLKQAALETLWSRFGGDGAFDRYVAAEGRALEEFATFQVLAEHHAGAAWRQWPSDHRRADAPAVRRFAADHRARVGLHQWMQWLIDGQLARAATACRLMQDLPIGFDPEGADAWAWQDLIATGATVGAPPDRYIRLGQDWGLPPFIPHRLRATGYAPFIQTLRAALRHAGGLRIDHVMGLFRLLWIPRGMTPAEGAFVRYPAEDLLAIVALESHRARAVMVGEDLGTVEAGVRERLAAHDLLSYRVMWFETAPPSRYPRGALAAVNTHDLPTICGLWTGADVEAQRRCGLQPNEGALEAIRQRLGVLTGLADAAPVTEVIERTYARLAEAPSVIVTATLEDGLGLPDRPNMPSTTDQRPNWSLALPGGLESLERSPLAQAIAARLEAGRARRRAVRRTEVRPTSS
jgi:4-alpha-glucanotransferase